MKKLMLLGVLGAISVASAIDFTRFSDLEFAERYAFSTDRPALIAELKKDTGPWYFYSLLNLQTEGRFDDAKAFVKTASRNEHSAQEAWNELQLRQMFFNWEAALKRPREGGRTPDEFLAWDLGSFCHLWPVNYVREEPTRPNTYPSTLDQKYISFDAFASIIGSDGRNPDGYELNFRPIFFPDYEKKHRSKHDYYRTLTLDELADCASDEAEYVQVVLEKLEAGPEEDVKNDPTAQRAVLDRKLKFLRTRGQPYRHLRVEMMEKILELERARGNFSERALFEEYVAEKGAVYRSLYDLGPLAEDYLAAFRRAGDDLRKFDKCFQDKPLARLRATVDLLDGKEPAKADLQALSESDYRSLLRRVELKWSAANPQYFAADDAVTLTIDVKNVPTMRLAIYELDAFEALVKQDAEITSTIDLDGCVPTVERTFDYKDIPALRRHPERIELPELEKRGLYVVECSGAGLSSRALVRKGTLRIGERIGAGGLVFTALDEQGDPLPHAKLRLGATTYLSDAAGEIAVPFAVPKEAGEKTAVIGAGGLAVRHQFTLPAEKYALSLSGALPFENLVAGQPAKVVLKPRLTVAGEAISLSFLEKPTLCLTLTDFDGVESSHVEPCTNLVDDAELVVPFKVPPRLQRVALTLSGTIRQVSEGKDQPLAASYARNFSARPASGAEAIHQAFLRRGTEGYQLELKGLNGEPLAARIVEIYFKHSVFKNPLCRTLQTDAQGTIRLGALQDITCVSLRAPFEKEWEIGCKVSVPSVLTAAEGEKIELAVRALLDGSWPGANELKKRVRLVRTNAAGAITVDCLKALNYRDGILSLENLVAGDYTLLLLAENRTIRLHLTPTAAKRIAGGLIVGAHRGLTDFGAPSRLKIEAAEVAKDGKLKVQLANAGEGARVHLVARRFISSRDDSQSLAELLAEDAAEGKRALRQWTPPRTDYLSERDLGDKLRYILDRRNLPHRPGNMLERPSLILNPWSEKETATNEETVRNGEDWKEAEAAAEVYGGRHGGSVKLKQSLEGSAPYAQWVLTSFDFLVRPAEVWCNLRPNAAGVVEFQIPGGAEFHDFEVLAVDARGLDSVRLTLPLSAPARHDCRFAAASRDAQTPLRTKAYSSLEELMAFLANDVIGEDFAFLGEWERLKEPEKRTKYGEYASHELDLFLYFHDRAFFDAVVSPHLRNKRVKRFMDKWLLGEKLDEFAASGSFQSLNALEKCLLAMRDQKWAKMVYDCLASENAAKGVDPALEDRLLAEALGLGGFSTSFDSAAACEVKCAKPLPALQYAASSGGFGSLIGAERISSRGLAGLALDAEPPAEELEEADAEWSNQAVQLPRAEAARKRKLAEGLRHHVVSARRNADRARRENRPLYRPPERTREWLETDHYRLRRAEEDPSLIPANLFWTRFARAILEGRADSFRDTSIMFVREGSWMEFLGALAVVNLKEPIVFTERKLDPTARGTVDLGLIQRFYDPTLDREDRQDDLGIIRHTYGVKEFVAGRTYVLSTVLSNPTDERLVCQLRFAIPDGAIALESAPAEQTLSVSQEERSMTAYEVRFYFPTAEGEVGAVAPAYVAVDGLVRAESVLPACKVVATPSQEDPTSWHWISQNGTNEEVLRFLKTANLASPTVDLALMGWRMRDRAFAEEVYTILSARGIYHEGLWRTALQGRYALTENQTRVRELLSRPENKRTLAQKLGPYFRSPLVEIEPEESLLYTHKEYWPLINARFHPLGGKATIANESLKKQYRAFLDILALKQELSVQDRLEAAVYLIAQDRVEEAEKLTAGIRADDVETKMQLDYLKAYFAFSNLKPEEGRKIAARYADYPIARWRERFARILAEADEIAGRTNASELNGRADLQRAPSIELSRAGAGEIEVKTRHVKKAILRAYPTDLEVMFSKDPFGGATVKSASSFLKPVWTKELKLDSSGRARVELPKKLRGVNLIVEAKDDEERVSATETILSGTLDVQALKEYGELRVRDQEGRAIPAAYVKVYARDASGTQVKFYKDGYTDLRGAFDYAGVSTDSEFRPEEFAILVFHDTKGVKILLAPRP